MSEFKRKKEKREWEMSLVSDRLKEFLNREKEPKILEFGAGYGHQLPFLKKLGKVKACDIREKILPENRAGIEFHKTSITHTPFANGEFDLIFSNHVIEHIDDLPAAFAEMKRIGKEDCTYAFAVPTNVWLILSIPAQYFNKIKGLIERFVGGKSKKEKRNDDETKFSSKLESGKKNISRLEKAKYFLLPNGHGEFKKFWPAFKAFQIKNWEELFARNGFVIVKKEPLLLYAPSEFPIIPTNRIFARGRLCSSVLFIIKKKSNCEVADCGNLKKENILFLINNFGIGGAEKVFANQINFLHHRGYKVWLGTLYNLSSSVNWLESAKIPADRIAHFGFRKMNDLRGFLAINRFLREKGISLIYSTLEESNFISRVLKILNPRLRAVIREANDANKKSWKFKIADVLLNFLVHKIIAVSRGVRDSLISYQKIHGKKIKVVENGVAVPHIDYNKVFGNKASDEITILNVGSLTPQKNQKTLIEIFSNLKKTPNTKLKLIIAGKGDLHNELEEKIREKGVEAGVRLVGSIDSEKIKGLYLDSHIFVTASLWEGFPNAVLEAMSYGLPVVSFKTAGSEDAIQDGVSGFLAELGDLKDMEIKIAKLVNDQKMRYDMGLKAMEKIRKDYSLDRSLANFLEALK